MVRRSPGFGRLAWLTALGAVIPGSSLLAAGRRWTGATALVVWAALLGSAIALVATDRVTDVAWYVGVRPDLLRTAGVASIVLALAWGAVIIGGSRALRHDALPAVRVVALDLLAICLCVPIALAGVAGARTAFAQRVIITDVFGQPPVPELSPASGTAPSSGAGPAAADEPWGGQQRINVLLLGSDAGTDRIGTRPDTIAVASVDTRTGDTVLLSLPRNLQNVPFPAGSPLHDLYPNGYDCGDECLLNAVWRNVGESRPDLFPGDPNPGLTATWQAVGEILGIRLDYYVVVNLVGFIDVVDALGGVTVTVPHELVVGDPADPVAVLPPGRQHLDGQGALWFARVRQGYDDYDRMRRQRCLIGALAQQADPVRLLARLPALAASAGDLVATDIPQDRLPDLVELARKVAHARLSSVAFTDEVIDPADPDFDRIRQLVQDALTAPHGAGPDPGPAQDLAEVC